MDMVDTTKNEGKGILGVYKKFDHIKIGGYIQPQFQMAADKGIKSYEGGDFGAQVGNRFMQSGQSVPGLPTGRTRQLNQS